MSSYADVQRILRGPGTSSRLACARDTARTQRLVAAWGDGIISHPHMSRADPPEHSRLRTPLARSFAPRVIEGLRDRIRTTIDDLLPADQNDCDLVATLARPLPYRIMCGLLGCPTNSDDSLLIECSHAFVEATLEPFLDATEVDKVVTANGRLTAEIRCAWSGSAAISATT